MSRESRPGIARSAHSAWPLIAEIVAPRLWLLGGGLCLMVVNRASGLVLPASSKFLVDDVVGKHHANLLRPLVAAVLAATLIRG